MLSFVVGFFVGGLTMLTLYGLILVSGEDEERGHRERTRK